MWCFMWNDEMLCERPDVMLCGRPDVVFYEEWCDAVWKT